MGVHISCAYEVAVKRPRIREFTLPYAFQHFPQYGELANYNTGKLRTLTLDCGLCIE